MLPLLKSQRINTCYCQVGFEETVRACLSCRAMIGWQGCSAFGVGQGLREENLAWKSWPEQESPAWRLEVWGGVGWCVLVIQSCLTLWPHGLQPARFLCPWNSPGKNTGVGCLFRGGEIWPIGMASIESFIVVPLKPSNVAQVLAVRYVGSVVKNLPANSGDAGLIPVSGRFPWRRKWQPTPVFSPGKSHGQRSLAGYSPWGCRVRDDLSDNSVHMTCAEKEGLCVRTEVLKGEGTCPAGNC